MSYQTQKILLTGNIDDESYNYLLWCCEQSNKLYNSTLFLVRQSHFDVCGRNQWFDSEDNYRSSMKMQKVKVSYPTLCAELKASKHYQAIGGQQGQQTIKSVVEGIKGYNKLLPLWFKGELKSKPKLPNYRKHGLYQLCFPAQNIRYESLEGFCYLPIANSQRQELEVPSITIPSGIGFESEQMAEVRIIPSQGKLWAEYVYKSPDYRANNLDYSQALGIDPGLTNWLTCVSTQGKSFIVNGKKIKSINQRYNRFVAKYKQGKGEFYWDHNLAEKAHKRSCQMRDAVNKAARLVINYCLSNGIGNLVFGWNQGNKQNINIGSRNNQNFVQVPTARLKNRIQELAESVGIRFVETEESYTSKASFIERDLLPKYGEKPKGYNFSGKRVCRGMYQAFDGSLINADCNGAANIIRKVATQLGINLAKVGRGVLALPKRYDLTELSRSYRKRCETVLQPL